MKVYAVVSHYYNGEGYWESVLDLYQLESDAHDGRVMLENDNTDEGQSYSVQEMVVV